MLSLPIGKVKENSLFGLFSTNQIWYVFRDLIARHFECFTGEYIHMDRIWAFIEKYDVEAVTQLMNEWQLGNLIANPYFLGGAAVVALLASYMKWRGLLAIDVGIVGFAYLLSFTLEQGTEVQEVYSESLLMFVGGGVVIVAAVIYLLFLKSD